MMMKEAVMSLLRVISLWLILTAPLWAFPIAPVVAGGPFGPDSVTPLMVPFVSNGFYSGSGVTIGQEVLTASHIVRNRQGFFVQYGRATTLAGIATVICQDADVDFAVLHPDVVPVQPVMQIRTDLPYIGEQVVVAGWPSGTFTAYAVRVRDIHGPYVIKVGKFRIPASIVVDWTPAVSPFGVSGGAMLDMQGRLVGIVCCVNDTPLFRQVAVVPISWGIKSCPLSN